MNKWMKALLAGSATALLAGCAGTQQSARISPPSGYLQVDNVDTRYVAAVEVLAKQHGTTVMWVNPPVKPVPKVVATSR